MGLLIVVEGTDCSGKETQSMLLKERLIKDGYKIAEMSFPMYDTPTGKIVGGPYLGKESISHGYFEEGASHVPPKVASLYYVADRLYNLPKITAALEENDLLILDRYVTSNMGHQVGKLQSKEERLAMFKWLEQLEYDLVGLPRPDIGIFLHMPYEFSEKLKQNREELDEHEKDINNSRCAEIAYLEMAELYDFIQIECTKDNELRTITDIHEDVYQKLVRKLDCKPRVK